MPHLKKMQNMPISLSCQEVAALAVTRKKSALAQEKIKVAYPRKKDYFFRFAMLRGKIVPSAISFHFSMCFK
ncbi:MAG: hypothetical protein ACYC2W_09125 [Desulfurivibrionaceae bacterium]